MTAARLLPLLLLLLLLLFLFLTSPSSFPLPPQSIA
jgi:hypothetical protein